MKKVNSILVFHIAALNAMVPGDVQDSRHQSNQAHVSYREVRDAMLAAVGVHVGKYDTEYEKEKCFKDKHFIDQRLLSGLNSKFMDYAPFIAMLECGALCWLFAVLDDGCRAWISGNEIPYVLRVCGYLALSANCCVAECACALCRLYNKVSALDRKIEKYEAVKQLRPIGYKPHDE